MPITVETARKFAAKSAIVRAERKRELLQAEKTLKAIVYQPSFAPRLASHDEYVSQTLTRVRTQLEKVYELFRDETDPAKLDRLASAQARLAEQERQLAGRPLPGSLKPSSKPNRSRASQFSQPVEPDEPDSSGPAGGNL